MSNPLITIATSLKKYLAFTVSLAFACFALMCFSALALAEATDRDKPIDLEADTVIVDDAKQISTYTGNVVLTQGTLVIHADQLIVREDGTGFQHSTSLGNPTTFKQKIEGEDKYMEGNAQRIEYDGRMDKVQLYTKASVKRGEDIIHGDYISYDANSEYAEVIGGVKSADGVTNTGRVHAVIQSKSKKPTLTVSTPPASVPPTPLPPAIEAPKPVLRPELNTDPIKDSRFSRSLSIGVDQK